MNKLTDLPFAQTLDFLLSATQMQTNPPRTLFSSFEPLRQRNFAIYLSGQIASALDLQAQQAFLGDLSGMALLCKAINLNATFLQAAASSDRLLRALSLLRLVRHDVLVE